MYFSQFQNKLSEFNQEEFETPTRNKAKKATNFWFSILAGVSLPLLCILFPEGKSSGNLVFCANLGFSLLGVLVAAIAFSESMDYDDLKKRGLYPKLDSKLFLGDLGKTVLYDGASLGFPSWTLICGLGLSAMLNGHYILFLIGGTSVIIILSATRSIEKLIDKRKKEIENDQNISYLSNLPKK